MTESLTIVAPVAIPLVLAVVCLAVPRRLGRLRGSLGVAGAFVQLVAAASLLWEVAGGDVLVAHLGGWEAPVGISFAADTLAGLLVFVSGLVGLAGFLYAKGVGVTEFKGKFETLTFVLLAGVNGAFLTADIFNLYVWFEVMLIASFVLVALPGGRAKLEAATKYLVLNFVASVFFLSGIGVLYGKVGTLNYGDLALKLSAVDDPGFLMTSGGLLLAAFLIKAGAFPFFFWLPASYPAVPTAAAAVFAGLLTKVGVYALLRVFGVVFSPAGEFFAGILLPVGVATMAFGIFGAASQFTIPKILSFHIVSQIGYMVAGIGMFGAAAFGATIFYVIHHILVKTNLFLLGGVVGLKTGSQDLKVCGGLFRSSPWLAGIFLIPALSLGGIPPLSGFFAKFAFFDAGVAGGYWVTVVVAAGVGVLTLYSMIKIWNEAFWKKAPEDGRETRRVRPVPPTVWVAVAGLATVTVVVSLFPAPLFSLAEMAADGIVNPGDYILRLTSPLPAS